MSKQWPDFHGLPARLVVELLHTGFCEIFGSFYEDSMDLLPPRNKPKNGSYNNPLYQYVYNLWHHSLNWTDKYSLYWLAAGILDENKINFWENGAIKNGDGVWGAIDFEKKLKLKAPAFFSSLLARDCFGAPYLNVDYAILFSFLLDNCKKIAYRTSDGGIIHCNWTNHVYTKNFDGDFVYKKYEESSTVVPHGAAYIARDPGTNGIAIWREIKRIRLVGGRGHMTKCEKIELWGGMRKSQSSFVAYDYYNKGYEKKDKILIASAENVTDDKEVDMSIHYPFNYEPPNWPPEKYPVLRYAQKGLQFHPYLIQTANPTYYGQPPGHLAVLEKYMQT